MRRRANEPEAAAPDAPGRQAPLARAAGELAGMPRWKKKLLAGFLVFAIIGAGMRAAAWLDRGPDQPAASEAIERSADGAVAEGDSRSFIDTSRGPRDGPSGGEESTEPADAPRSVPWTGRLGGWMAKIGLSFAVGLVLGVFFRAFLKTMAMITALVVAGIVAMSYFDVLGFDFSTMRQNFEALTGWAGERGYALKDFVVGVLPSAGAGVFGFVVGFLRR